MNGLLTNPVGSQVGCPTLEEQAKPGPVGWAITASSGVKQGFETFLILGQPTLMAFSTLPEEPVEKRPRILVDRTVGICGAAHLTSGFCTTGITDFSVFFGFRLLYIIRLDAKTPDKRCYYVKRF
jgi:hypothetical protein